MIARLHQQKYAPKDFEVDTLLGMKWVLHEEWDDAFTEIPSTTNPIGPSVAVIPSHHTATEEFSEGVEEIHIAFVLHDSELRKYLIAASQFVVSIDTDVEAAFTVHEACDPFGM